MLANAKLVQFFKIVVIGLLVFLLIASAIKRLTHFEVTESQFSSSVNYVKYEPENANPVNEDAVSKIVYVNPQKSESSDSNLGTEELPIKTLKQATKIIEENLANNLGTKVIIYPGVYRESIELKSNKNTFNAPIIFEAKKTGSVIISGSEDWKNWAASEENFQIFTHKWNEDWGVHPNPWSDYDVDVEPIVRRKEMVFVNGGLLQQKLSLTELTEGTFYVSEKDDLLYIYPPAGARIEKSKVEVAKRGFLLFSEGVNNLVVRGLTFQHAATYFNYAAVSIRSGSNILIEDSNFIWNNGGGLNVIKESENVIVRNVRANYNGIRGLGGYNLKNILYENVESSYNNWRGDWGGFNGWDPGQKFINLRNATFRRYKAVGNQAAGLWLDYDNAGIWIDQAYICDNFHTGLYIEASHHVVVSNSKICNNRANPKSLYHHPGILGAHASHVILENNVICGNDRSQIKINGEPRQVLNWETQEKYQLVSDYWELKNNIIVGNKNNQLLIYLQPNHKNFTDTLVSQDNIWYNPESDLVFQIHPRGVVKDFEAWQKLVGEDKNSVFASPSSNFSCN